MCCAEKRAKEKTLESRIRREDKQSRKRHEGTRAASYFIHENFKG